LAVPKEELNADGRCEANDLDGFEMVRNAPKLCVYQMKKLIDGPGNPALGRSTSKKERGAESRSPRERDCSRNGRIRGVS
jgi:hypothetical protein